MDTDEAGHPPTAAGPGETMAEAHDDRWGVVAIPLGWSFYFQILSIAVSLCTRRSD